jgi:hypothetical protein
MIKNGFLSQFFVFDLHWGGKSGKKIRLVRNPFQQGGVYASESVDK